MTSPTWAAGLRLRASARVISRESFSTRVLDHQEVARQAQLAGLGVDLGMDVGLGAVARAGGLGDRVLHRVEHDLLVDRLLARDRVGDLQEFKPVGADSHRGHSFVDFMSSWSRGSCAGSARGLVGSSLSSSSSSVGTGPAPQRFADERIGENETRLGEIGAAAAARSARGLPSRRGSSMHERRRPRRRGGRRGSACGRPPARPSRSWPRSPPSARNRWRAPAAGRFPGDEISR